MWTEAHRARQEAGLKHVLPLQAVGQIAAWLERADPPRSGRGTSSVAVVDTQSVKCVPVRGPRGSDAAQKVVGRRRVMLADADGAVLAVAVLDGAFTAERCRGWCHRHGMRHRVVAREPGQRGLRGASYATLLRPVEEQPA